MQGRAEKVLMGRFPTRHQSGFLLEAVHLESSIENIKFDDYIVVKADINAWLT